MGNLTPELELARQKICKIAKDYGLDFFDTIFEMVSYDFINRFAAYGGFPVRYPHWKFGMEYEHLSKSYQYGLSKIYEMVINTDPCYAYLMEGNANIDQKLVMAHVYGHCDFFKNNIWFSKTNRKMMDQMANHAVRIRRYMDRYGYDHVEKFIDRCLSIENLIDRHSVYSNAPGIGLTGSAAGRNFSQGSFEEHMSQSTEEPSYRLQHDRDYMRNYINPPEFLNEQRKKRQDEANKKRTFPERPTKDILKFLIDHGPLHEWQQEILSIIRDEAYYFAPQGMTKTMNEGWASYWHSKIMTQNILNDSEIIDFADHHSGTTAMSPQSYNPYKVGIELLRNIEDRWNKGQFGREWESCDDIREKKNWNTNLGLGRDKIFQVRKTYNDVTFIDEFLTQEFCVENKMFVYQFNQKTQRFEVNTRDFKAIKAKLLFQMTNFGRPSIAVQDANFENRGELLMTHSWEGLDLQPDFMNETMRNIYALWGRPLHIATVMDEKPCLISFDGTDFKQKNIEAA